MQHPARGRVRAVLALLGTIGRAALVGLGPSAAGAEDPPPIDAGFPTAATTGYPHGLPGDTRTPVTLTPYTGPTTITVPGTVIESKHITDRLNIRAANVTIRNSLIQVTNSQAINITNNPAYWGLKVIDTEIDGTRTDNSTGGISLIGDGGYRLIRVDAHSSGDIARANWGGVAIIDSWLHDPYCVQETCHNDVIQTTEANCVLGTSSVDGLVAGTSDKVEGSFCIKILGNRLENPFTQTSLMLFKADQGDIHDVLVAGNLLNGGGYGLYWYDHNVGTYRSTHGTVLDNRWMRAPTGGYFVKGGLNNTHAFRAALLPTWSGNRWADTGARIPR